MKLKPSTEPKLVLKPSTEPKIDTAAVARALGAEIVERPKRLVGNTPEFYAQRQQQTKPGEHSTKVPAEDRPRNFLKEICELYPNDLELKQQWGILAELAFEEDPSLTDKLFPKAVEQGKKEGIASGRREMLQKMLALKLGRDLDQLEQNHFEEELQRIGTDGVMRLIIASDKKVLAWLSTKPAPKKAFKK